MFVKTSEGGVLKCTIKQIDNVIQQGFFIWKERMNVKVFKLEDKDIPKLWEIVKTYPNFFADDAMVDTLSDFVKWFKEINKGAIVGYDDYGLVGCCFLDEIHDGMGSLNIIFKRHQHPVDTFNLSFRGLKYFFRKYHLKFIYGITRVNNYPCIKIMKKLGFVFKEVLEGYKIVKGKKTDYILGGIVNDQRREA